MKEPLYVITGVSRLTGTREEVSRHMPKAMAVARLEQEKIARAKRRHPAFVRLRVERVLPTELTLNFLDHDT